VRWVVADVTTWEPSEAYDVWHDRSAFHFLTEPKDRTAYAERVSKAVRPGGHVIIGTFALDGPERCSGWPCVRGALYTVVVFALGILGRCRFCGVAHAAVRIRSEQPSLNLRGAMTTAFGGSVISVPP